MATISELECKLYMVLVYKDHHSLTWLEGVRSTLRVENLKTVIKFTKPQSAFHYHPVPAILNNVSDKILLPKKSFVV